MWEIGLRDNSTQPVVDFMDVDDKFQEEHVTW